MRVGPHSMVTAALLIVMPLAFSSGSKSVVVLPSSTSPALCLEPPKYRMRSVVVVLPASTWAMMPMLRRFSIMVVIIGKDGARVPGVQGPAVPQVERNSFRSPLPGRRWGEGGAWAGNGRLLSAGLRAAYRNQVLYSRLL